MANCKIPIASGFAILFCGSCPNAHLVFKDDSGMPICQGTISAQQCRDIEKLIKARDPNYKEEEVR